MSGKTASFESDLTDEIQRWDLNPPKEKSDLENEIMRRQTCDDTDSMFMSLGRGLVLLYICTPLA